MPPLHLMVEDMRQLVGCHTLTSICHREFYIAVALGGRDFYTSTLWRELAGIVG